MEINSHYYTRYKKFINRVKSKREDTSTRYIEIHHIIPQCIGGSNSPENLIRLEMREHFLAHWLLWKAYPGSFSLASAFLQMAHKNPKGNKPFQGRITGRVYAKLKQQAYSQASKRMTGRVFVKDSNGATLELSKEEYAKQKKSFPFHTTGKVSAINRSTGELEWISSADYQKNKDNFIVRVAYCENIKYRFENQQTKEIIWCTRKEAREINAKANQKLLKKFAALNIKIKCNDSAGTVLIPAKEYDPLKHRHVLLNTMQVFDNIENRFKSIVVFEYHKNPDRYRTSTKGKVLAKDKHGRNILVTKEEFETGQFVGQTAGLRTVFDTVSQTYKQITKEEWVANKSNYKGPCTGKVNVINIKTGIRQQISKLDFDPACHLPLGNKKFLFRCRNQLTKKEKHINIYEWQLVKDQYEILDNEK